LAKKGENRADIGAYPARSAGLVLIVH